MTVEELLSLIAGNFLGIAICAVGIVLSLRLTRKEKSAGRLYRAGQHPQPSCHERRNGHYRAPRGRRDRCDCLGFPAGKT